MAEVALNETWTLTVPESMQTQLYRHLFAGDGDEHGAVIGAGLVPTRSGGRLLARTLCLAVDGQDYVPGERGYKMLRAEFVRDRILECRDQRLVYLGVHNHLGNGDATFSSDDLRSHERGYPALLDIARGMPVGALVFTQNAVAGDIWLADRRRAALDAAIVIGRTRQKLTSSARRLGERVDPTYDRQARLFGDVGQQILADLKVGVIGAGGAGVLIVEYLARLGVGHIVVADPDRVEVSNLPRLPGATRLDALTWLTRDGRPQWLQKLGRRLSTRKVKLAARLIRRAHARARVDAICDDFLKPQVARQFLDCDFLFLAADPMPVRLLFNAIVHQYLIPGIQVGAKVQLDRDGKVLEVYSACRPVTPDSGCLWCNGLIPPGRLQEQAQREEERRRQRYVDDPTVTAPSVITLNATAAAAAVNDFLFTVTGLVDPAAPNDYVRFDPRRRAIRFERPRADGDCSECGVQPGSRRARGDDMRLPTRMDSGTG